MVLLIIIPMKNGYFIGNIPNIFRQTHMCDMCGVIHVWSMCDMCECFLNGFFLLDRLLKRSPNRKSTAGRTDSGCSVATGQQSCWKSGTGKVSIYPLVICYITMERSTFFNGKMNYKWPFSIAMLVITRGYQYVSLYFTMFNWGIWGYLTNCFVRFRNWNMWSIQNYPDVTCAIMQVWDIRMSCVCDLQSVFVSRGIMQRMPAKSSRAATSCPSCLHFFQV